MSDKIEEVKVSDDLFVESDKIAIAAELTKRGMKIEDIAKIFTKSNTEDREKVTEDLIEKLRNIKKDKNQ